MTKHTPTPWGVTLTTLSGKPIHWKIVSEKYGSTKILAEASEKLCNTEDADFIVRACNNHEALLESLKLLIDNISPEEWESLPAYVEQKVMQAFNAAKNAEA